MDTKKTKLLEIVLRISKWLVSSQRVRKLKKYCNMKQFKIAVFILGTIFIIWFMYWHNTHYMPTAHSTRSPKMARSLTSTEKYLIMGTPMKHMPLDVIYRDKNKDDDVFSEETKPVYTVDTPGCQIPFAMINYEKGVIAEKKLKRSGCGRRAVFLKKIDGYHVKASIDTRVMTKYLKKRTRFGCSYRFFWRSTRPGRETTKNKFSRFKKFINGDIITLVTDFINIRCIEYKTMNTSRTVYSDIYAFTKRLNTTTRSRIPASCRDKYNVLMLGMDSMSLPRFVQTMPITTDFLYHNFWLGYRGYHKVDDNTFPNLMAVLTGDKMKAATNKCQNKMDKCNANMLWSKFKDKGYVTAYGEDFLRLPDTFSKEYAFRKRPTDHYMRPFFVTEEKELDNSSLVCAGKTSSGQQILDYAADFVTTYRSDRFFGVFWINSFSHNENSRPQDADRLIEKFLNKIRYTGILDDTFVIFFSDHGIRFGRHRADLESYYDERLPFLFFWTPTKFKGKHWNEHRALAINQFKLVTPYDLYNTVMDIKKISTCDVSTHTISKACPYCHSLFTPVNISRRCQDVAIDDKWCSCHRLYPLDPQAQDTEGMKSVTVAVTHIRTVIKTIKTKRCWRCQKVALQNVIRIHFYYDISKTNLYYLVAFTMTPGNRSYEATVKKSQIVGPLSSISPYKEPSGDCAADSGARNLCVCEKIKNCK